MAGKRARNEEATEHISTYFTDLVAAVPRSLKSDLVAHALRQIPEIAEPYVDQLLATIAANNPDFEFFVQQAVEQAQAPVIDLRNTGSSSDEDTSDSEDGSSEDEEASVARLDKHGWLNGCADAAAIKDMVDLYLSSNLIIPFPALFKGSPCTVQAVQGRDTLVVDVDGKQLQVKARDVSASGYAGGVLREFKQNAHLYV